MSNGYAPRGDSLAARTINFLLDNPGEELTAHDIGVKFAADYKNVHTLLRKAVDAGLLKRTLDEGEYIYTPGARRPGAVSTLADTAPPAPTQGQPIVIELRLVITVDVRTTPTPTAQVAS